MLILPFLLGRLHERLQVVHEVVSIEIIVEQGADRALVRQLTRGMGVLGALEHSEYFTRDKVLQQGHCRPLIQVASVARRL